LPDANWRAIYQHLRAELRLDEACKRVVGALKLAADQDQAGPVGAWWWTALKAGDNPTLIELQDRFGAKPQPLRNPPVSTQHLLASYDGLIREACHG